MKIQYKIIWIDDNIEDYVEAGIISEFEEYLNNLGFEPVIALYETGELALIELKRQKKYDLIISDYYISGDEQGDSLINRIRQGAIFTEVLFYSAQPNFKVIAQKLFQDRVSFLSLEGDDGFREFKKKVYWLIDLTIQKLQELNNIRGLVMAETSELDNVIEEILIEVIKNDQEMAQVLRKYMIKKIETNDKDRKKILDKIETLTNEEIIKNRILFDAYKKSRTLNEFINKKGLSKGKIEFKNFHENYNKDVLVIRNDLAHAKSEIIDNIEVLILSRKDGEQPQKIDQEECIKIRKNLRKYSELLYQIRESVFT